MTRRDRGRRLLYALALIAPIWALIAMASGGVGWMIGPIRLSSRQPLRPALVGVLAAGCYVWRFSRDEIDADSRWLEHIVRRILTFLPALVVLLSVFIGLHYGSFAAAGSDSYGYVSQAGLWLRGNLHIEQPWVQKFSWPGREWIFAPLGYRPLGEDGTIVPTYSPGLPMLMAVFLRAFGSNGPFYVIPLLGALVLWLTYLLGKEVTGSRSVGTCAAIFLLASPIFVAHLLLPMTDVPMATGWTLVCWLALKEPRPRSLLAGLASSAMLLIRPNLLLLIGAPVAAWAWPCVQGRAAWREAAADVTRFAVGIVPGLLFIAILNARLYGSPFASGYGNLGDMYNVGRASQNLYNYGKWLIQSQTVFVAFALVPFFSAHALRTGERRSSARVGLGSLLVLTLISYIFYEVFSVWFYLRFLLPALPALFVLMAAGIRATALKLPAPARVPIALLLSLTCCAYAVRFARDQFVLNERQFEQRHIRAAQYVAQLTPENAVILSVQHSGSIRYYAHRITLRYDALHETALDTAIRDLNANGYRPFIVVDDWEETEFRNLFAKQSRAGRLDWRPLVRISTSPEVHIYDPEGRVEPARPTALAEPSKPAQSR